MKGTASNCNLVKICPKVGCDQKVSFMEETCYHMVMSGLLEQDLKEKVVTQAMLNTVKDLPTLLNYVTAEESARAKTGVHESPSISGVKLASVATAKVVSSEHPKLLWIKFLSLMLIKLVLQQPSRAGHRGLCSHLLLWCSPEKWSSGSEK